MISPERLRQYPLFSMLNENQLIEVALISNEENYQAGELIFREGELADFFYILVEGCVDLYYTVVGVKSAIPERGIPVGEINPGEPFGISALIEPHRFTSSAFASQPSRAIKIEAKTLRELFSKDKRLAYYLTYSAAKAALERLQATRVQLAAAWA